MFRPSGRRFAEKNMRESKTNQRIESVFFFRRNGVRSRRPPAQAKREACQPWLAACSAAIVDLSLVSVSLIESGLA